MNHEEFGLEVARFLDRVAALRNDLPVDEVSPLCQRLFEELSTSAEELAVAEEELRRQNDELSLAHTDAQEQRRRYRELFMSAPDPYFVTDPRGVVFEANYAGRALLGGGRRELVGKPLGFYIKPDDRAQFFELLERLRGRERRVEAELTCQRLGSNGQGTPCLVAGFAIRDLDGNVTGVRWMIRDLTAREHTLRSERLAREARNKDEFLAALGHELRNPLAPIALTTKMLLDHEDALPPERRRWGIEVIRRQTHQLQRLVDDLLDVARLSRGQIALRREPVEVSALARQELDDSRPVLDARRHTLAVELPDEDIVVEADPARLRQIIANLLDNAAKYTPEGGHIWFRLAREGEQVTLTIQDDGLGISADALEQIFDVAAERDAVPDRARGGLGLGLALVQRLVRLHGGQVQAQSPGLGQGSAFVVTLPAPAQAAAVTPAARPVAAASPAPRRVLVVDDNADAAEALALAIEGMGHQVRVAHDAVSAVTAARDFEPDLGLLDIGLPGMDGCGLARELFREHPDIELAAVTGYGDGEHRRRIRAAGFRHYLLKPVDWEDLEALVAAPAPS